MENLPMHLYTGGLFETNSYYLPESRILIDAPEGVAQWLSTQGFAVGALLLTHGHVDHVWDAAQVQREHDCSVFYHSDTQPMVLDPVFYQRLGMPWKVDPIAPGILVEASKNWEVNGISFNVLEVPGHCPGSLCFHQVSHGVLFGGDVLFAGGVGRWDLPGGDKSLLLNGIHSKLLTLDDSVKVLAGHGPATTIGIERKGNPYLL